MFYYSTFSVHVSKVWWLHLNFSTLAIPSDARIQRSTLYGHGPWQRGHCCEVNTAWIWLETKRICGELSCVSLVFCSWLVIQLGVCSSCKRELTYFPAFPLMIWIPDIKLDRKWATWITWILKVELWKLLLSTLFHIEEQFQPWSVSLTNESKTKHVYRHAIQKWN